VAVAEVGRGRVFGHVPAVHDGVCAFVGFGAGVDLARGGGAASFRRASVGKTGAVEVGLVDGMLDMWERINLPDITCGVDGGEGDTAVEDFEVRLVL
jgi:hypothetical protein